MAKQAARTNGNGTMRKVVSGVATAAIVGLASFVLANRDDISEVAVDCSEKAAVNATAIAIESATREAENKAIRAKLKDIHDAVKEAQRLIIERMTP